MLVGGFAARHGIAPQIESFPMARLNDAMKAHVGPGTLADLS